MSTFMVAPIPSDESERLVLLRSHGIVDSARETEFDDLTQFACAVFGVRDVQINLIEADRQFTKSAVRNSSTNSLPREMAFCPHALLCNEPLVVPDTFRDLRFRNNPFVFGDDGVRFYAGSPLFARNGVCLGTFCLIDNKPWQNFSHEHQVLLKHFARLTTQLIEARGSRSDAAGVSDLRAWEQSVHGLLLVDAGLQVLHVNAVAREWLNGELHTGPMRKAGESAFWLFVRAACGRRGISRGDVGIRERVLRIEIYRKDDQLAVFSWDVSEKSRLEHQASDCR